MFKRVNGKLVKVEKAPKVLVKDGRQMAVLRPISPEAAKLALDKAKQMVTEKSDDQERFNAILSEQGTMIFAGFASTKGRLLDPKTLEDIGPIEPGDSFVAVDDLHNFKPVPQG
jgi:hypothetical protein